VIIVFCFLDINNKLMFFDFTDEDNKIKNNFIEIIKLGAIWGFSLFYFPRLVYMMASTALLCLKPSLQGAILCSFIYLAFATISSFILWVKLKWIEIKTKNLGDCSSLLGNEKFLCFFITHDSDTSRRKFRQQFWKNYIDEIHCGGLQLVEWILSFLGGIILSIFILLVNNNIFWISLVLIAILLVHKLSECSETYTQYNEYLHLALFNLSIGTSISALAFCIAKMTGYSFSASELSTHANLLVKQIYDTDLFTWIDFYTTLNWKFLSWNMFSLHKPS
jgi:hypothetical protein